ncbi:stress protein [Streptomyces sp. SID4919]|uniref:TerD family protein n=1 Tax=unclassified Streptomyces TaxID=2593676 RepID=UPI0008238539|nr:MULTISPECIES: TerD family protein [unclassified Streptomyces]MYY11316.1 stress protein [Streptomyces sp. SID4919]SCK17482.1 Stress response protein SCP2 [Streptomyces sp. AmelKG-E11A]
MAREFQRGHKARISDLTAGTDLYIGVQIAGPGLSFDISCFGLDADDQLSDDQYFIFFNQPKSPEEAIQLLGAQAGDTESFRVTLEKIPAAVQRLTFTATIDGDGQMSQVAPGYLRIVAGGEEVARYAFDGSEFTTERAVMLGDLYLKDVWRFAAVGQGFDGGLEALLRNFGGEVAAEEEPAAPEPVPGFAPPAQAAPGFAPPAQATAPPAFAAPPAPAQAPPSAPQPPGYGQPSGAPTPPPGYGQQPGAPSPPPGYGQAPPTPPPGYGQQPGTPTPPQGYAQPGYGQQAPAPGAPVPGVPAPGIPGQQGGAAPFGQPQAPAQPQVPAQPQHTGPAPFPGQGTPQAPVVAGLAAGLQRFNELATGQRWTLQSEKLARVDLGTGGGPVLARQGSMVLYQGKVDFSHKSAGFAGRVVGGATGQEMQLMRCTGKGQVFLAEEASHLHTIELQGDGVCVSAENVMAFDESLQYEVRRIEGHGIPGGALFTMQFQGIGTLVVKTHGVPVVMPVTQSTFADCNALVAWSSGAQVIVTSQVRLRSNRSAGSTGEGVNLQFRGAPGNFIVVQPYEV